MGSVIVGIMADSTLAAEHKKLHPFFTAPKTIQPESQSLALAPAATTATTTSEPAKAQEKMGELDEAEVTPAKRKRRKDVEDGDGDDADTKKPKRGRPKKVVQQGPSIMKHFSKVDGTSQEPVILDQSSTNLEHKESKTTTTSTPQAQSEACSIQNGVAIQEDEDSAQKHNIDDKQTPPKKMLQFNPKTGTIGSPPKPKEPNPSEKKSQKEDLTEDTRTPPYRVKRRPHRIATISYGLDDASRIRVGARIDGILNDTTIPSPKRKKGTRMSSQERKKAQNADLKESEDIAKKDTHPFFTGKAKKPAIDPDSVPTNQAVKLRPDPAPTRPRIFSSTPCSPRKPRPAVPSAPLPQFGVRLLGLKTPGAQHPAWPSKGMVHVRDVDDVSNNSPPGEKMAARKSKGNTTHVTATESLLNNFAKGLHVSEVLDAVKNADTENFRPPPSELRLPQKHFESGVKLKRRVLQEVKNAKHPALTQLCDSLVTTLSVFDRYTCESVCWAQKYTPKSAVEVLQYGKEAFLLRDWLEAMKVLSVDTGEVKVKIAKPPKKKRKKNKDDFIVDSDEEANGMDEVSDLEEQWSPDRRGVKKTVIRSGDNAAMDSKNPGRLTNTVVISGPHGCGKTSAVYAIAKELDFEVFEINSGSRRSGKDILEKIGDMTRNHLVQHQQTEVSAAVIDEDEIAQDIKSGKQATMKSFFQPKATPKPAEPKPVKGTLATKTESKKTSPKSQKQSLILLDEVDILYEDDKQFWSTVITLVAQSKRPFIMTCNDEYLVPLQTLSLHGIFRFSTAPTELAVDRLLMVAACEGHALRRNAVEALYKARQQDLRACLMDLNYWCQVAVGANRGGIDWLLPRWPKGRDVDEDGNIVRVISQDTYVEGMGWLGRDIVAQEAEAEHGNIEEELLQEVKDFWQIDLADWHDSLNLPSWGGAVDDTQDQLSLLQRYEEFTDAMSLADLSSMPFATSIEEPIDCTLPEMTQKAREDYVLGRQLLDAPVRSTYDPLATSLPMTLKCLGRKMLQASFPGQPPHLGELNEASIISKIRHHASASPETTGLTRNDFSLAFDVLAISEKEASSLSSYLDPSVFDGTLRNITVDVAPYVRNIVAFEKELQKQRQKLSSLLSQGGRKRGRKTRAAHAALEGGSRSTVRREKWFDADLNGVLVMRTAGEGWAGAMKEDSSVTSSASPANSAARKAQAHRVATDGCNDDDDSGLSGTDVE